MKDLNNIESKVTKKDLILGSEGEVEEVEKIRYIDATKLLLSIIQNKRQFSTTYLSRKGDSSESGSRARIIRYMDYAHFILMICNAIKEIDDEGMELLEDIGLSEHIKDWEEAVDFVKEEDEEIAKILED